MTVVRRLYPTICDCSHCGHHARHRDICGSRHGILRTKRCLQCGRTFRVAAIAEEHDDGGAWTKVRAL